METRDQRIIRLATMLLEELRAAGYPMTSFPGYGCAGIDINQYGSSWADKSIEVRSVPDGWTVEGETTENFFTFLPKPEEQEEKTGDEE